MRVSDIFYSLQGEGYHAGRAAVFIRLSGCNLKCPFCDTYFSRYNHMDEDVILEKVKRIGKDCRFVVITGGEPTMHDCTFLVDLLHSNGYEVAMESNGTRLAPTALDWLTISPKQAFVMNGHVRAKECDEVKVIFDGIEPPNDYGIKADHYYLQPCDTGDEEQNKSIIKKCVEYIKENPKWTLSLQQQKILNIS